MATLKNIDGMTIINGIMTLLFTLEVDGRKYHGKKECPRDMKLSPQEYLQSIIEPLGQIAIVDKEVGR